MPKPRPGVEASSRLSKITDISIWISIEKQYGEMLLQKGGKKLVDLDIACEEISIKWQQAVTRKKEDAFCTCQDLYTIIEWKFATGKPRPLWKHIKSNSEETVRKVSKDAFDLIHKAKCDDKNLNTVIGNAVDVLSQLKGIGPASASAVLSLFRPDLMVFMYDEILDCFLGERKYTTAAYIKTNTICRDLVKDIGGGDGDFMNVRKVGQILWCAARLSLCKDKVDLTEGAVISSCQEKKETAMGDVGKDVTRTDDDNPTKTVKRRKTKK